MGAVQRTQRHTLASALTAARRRLAHCGIDTPALDARVLVAAACSATPLELVVEPQRQVDDEAMGRLQALLARRAAGEPVSRILGEREFWGLAFTIDAATLDPRPDSETVVRAALELLAGAGHSAPLVADLGTGSGCLMVALLNELPAASGVAIDIAPAALAVAARNAARHGVGERVRFLCADWLAPVAARFDLIVANPPYIASAALTGLGREVIDHDPRLALDGGGDGLDHYRRIAGQAPERLRPGGALVLEIGCDQQAAVSGLLRSVGFYEVATRHDLAGRPRCICATVSRE